MYFVSLTQWLLELCGSKNSGWNQYDDPGTVTNNIILDLKNLGVTVNYPATKLKPGSGEAVIQVLLELSKQALSNSRFNFKAPVIPDDDADEGDDEEDDMEGQADLADVQQEISDEEDIAELVEDEEVVEKDEDREILEAGIDPDEWEREVQRVSHKLKISKKLDVEDWRGHLEQTDRHARTMKENIPQVRQKLEQVSDEVTRALEKISKKELVLNKGMIGSSGKESAHQMKAVSDEHNTLKGRVEDMEAKYYDIQEELNKIESNMDEAGKKVTDMTPLTKIKKSIEKVQKDIKTIDIRIGVVSNTLLQTKIKSDEGDVLADNLFDEEDMEI